MNTNVIVGVRVRPPLKREIEDGKQFNNCVAVDGYQGTSHEIYVSLEDRPVILPGDGTVPAGVAKYTFDNCFDTTASQEQVYKAMVQPAVHAVVEGINSTVFAYGQTGTGKTYTMQGDLNSPVGEGMTPRAVRELFNHYGGSLGIVEENCEDSDELQQETTVEDERGEVDSESEEQLEDKPEFHRQNSALTTAHLQKSIYLSVLQIYGESITDLLCKGDSRKLKLRRNGDNQWFPEGLTEKLVNSPDSVFKLLNKAQDKRFSRCTNMNETSSRSHLIVTLTVIEVGRSPGHTKQLKGAKLNLVDLAGAERVKDSGVTGEALQEAAKINLSLCTLVAVVKSLSSSDKKTLTPYNNSILTRMLADSLGGNCRTTLIATLSPSQAFCRESNQTLTFAHNCKKVKNVVKKNLWEGSVPKGIPFTYKLPTTLDALKQKKIPWDDLKADISEETVSTKYGEVCIRRWNKLSGSSPPDPGCIMPSVVCTRFVNMDHQIPAFLFSGYQFIEVYQPGYGNTKGKKHPSRCNEIMSPVGPAYIMKSVMEILNIKSAVLAGYDWSASIALYMASKWPRLVSKVVSFHPSMGNTKEHRDLLGKIKVPVLLQWVPADMFHPWKKWKPLVSCLSDVTVSVMKIYPWHADCAKHSYEKFSNQVCIPIVKFLTGKDYGASTKEAFLAKPQQMRTTEGKLVTAMNNIMFAEQMTDEDLQLITERPDLCQKAVDRWRKHIVDDGTVESYHSTVVAALLNTTHPQRSVVLGLLRMMPELSLKTLSTPDMLVKFGVWPEIKGWDHMQDSPRYYPGRQILVKANVEPLIESENYCCFSSNTKQKYVTHNAILEGKDGSSFLVKVKGSDHQIKVSIDETLELNQPHVFKYDIVGNIVLEDSLVFNVKGHAEKAKLLEMIFKLAPIVEKLDFTSDDVYNLQLEAIRTVRECLDFIANNVHVKKIMHVDRATTGTVGKISLHGQGNCHGCSSVVGSYLQHFSGLLGIDVKYRSGYSFHDIPNDIVNPNVDKHQTIEVTCRPSMKSVIVDLWYEGVHQDSRWLCIPVEKYYQKKFYPNGLLVIGCTSKPVTETDMGFD